MESNHYILNLITKVCHGVDVKRLCLYCVFTVSVNCLWQTRVRWCIYWKTIQKYRQYGVEGMRESKSFKQSSISITALTETEI